MKISNNSNIAGASSKSNSNKTTTKDVFKDELGKFENLVRDRIENGEPTYSMGMTSMTEEDWEELMDNIDNYMEKAREIRIKQNEKAKEESLESRIYNKFYMNLQNTDDN